MAIFMGQVAKVSNGKRKVTTVLEPSDLQNSTSPMRGEIRVTTWCFGRPVASKRGKEDRKSVE
jgi:hypothetical protein